MAQQEENHKNVTRDQRHEIPSTFAVTQGLKQTHIERLMCKHCGKVGHNEAGCYELINGVSTRLDYSQWMWNLRQGATSKMLYA